MANVEISQFPTVVGALTGNEFVPVLQGGVNKKAAVSQLPSLDFSGPNGSESIGFIQAGAGAVTRTSQSKMRDVVSVKDFGAVGDGVTDDAAAIQAAIDFAEASGADVFFPAASYKCNSTLYVGRAGRVGLFGEGTAAFVADSNRCTKLDFSSIANNVVAIDCGATSGRRNGIALANLFIYRSESNPVVDGGGVGLVLRGMVSFDVRNVVTFGFDQGCYLTTAVGGGVCSGGLMEMCRFEENGRAAQHIDAAVECRFIRCKFGEGIYQIWLTTSALSDTPNGNQWVGGTAIASSGNLATNNLRIDSGFYNVFDGIAFEQASAQGIYIALPDAQAALDRNTAVFNAIWMNGNGGLYCYNGNIIVSSGSRIRSSRSTYPAIEFDSSVSVSASALHSVVADSYIGWSGAGSLSIEINRYWSAVITGNVIRDESDLGIAFVDFAGGGRNTVASNDLAGTHRPGWAGTAGANGNVFNNRLGSNSTAAVYTANDTLYATGPYVFTVSAVQYAQQRSGSSALTTGETWARMGGGGAWLNVLAVSTTDGTYGNVAAASDIGGFRAHAGDGTSGVEVASLLMQTDADSISGNATGRINFRTRPSGGALTTRLSILSTGVIVLTGLATYADNAAAVTGGVPLNGIYKTATGELRVRV